MQFASTGQTKSKYDYKMKGDTLEIVNHHPYLGVEFSDTLTTI